MSTMFHLFFLTDTGRFTQPSFVATQAGQSPPERIFGSGKTATHCLLLRPGALFGGQSEADILAEIERHGFAIVRAFRTDAEWMAWKRWRQAPLGARLRYRA